MKTKRDKFCGIELKISEFSEFSFFKKPFKQYITLNAQMITIGNQNKEVLDLLNKTNNCFDGAVPLALYNLLVKFRYLNSRKYTKLSGSDIIYKIFEEAKTQNKKVFLLGSSDMKINRAINDVKEKHSLDIYGLPLPVVNERFDDAAIAKILKNIESVRPDTILIFLPFPKQIYLSDRLSNDLDKLGISSVISLGGALDFFLEDISRAPRVISCLGLESLYRFIQEPKFFRLQRILISLTFLRYIFR